MMLYNSTKPPEYNLSNVQTKVHILFGTNDNLVVPEVCLTTSISMCLNDQLFKFNLNNKKKTIYLLFSCSFPEYTKINK